MKPMKRICSVLLSILLVLSLCGCSTETERLSAKRTFAYEMALNLDAEIETAAIARYKLKEGCRDKLNVMYFVTNDHQSIEKDRVLVNDLYMVDLDSGYWYLGSEIQEDQLNFDTKENALMRMYDAFDQARGDSAILEGKVQIDYLPEDIINEVNHMLEQAAQSKVPKPYPEEKVNLWVSSDRLEIIDGTIKQPAGTGRAILSTIADAIAYLNRRFPTVSTENMALSNGEKRILRSGKEILEEFRLPASRGDIATCVSYLIGENYQIETLIIFVQDDSASEPYPMAVNLMHTASGYWFLDPVALMDCKLESGDSKYLPERKCDSVDGYLEQIRQDFDVVAAYRVASGNRMDYEITSTGEIVVTTGAEAVYSKPIA